VQFAKPTGGVVGAGEDLTGTGTGDVVGAGLDDDNGLGSGLGDELDDGLGSGLGTRLGRALGEEAGRDDEGSLGSGLGDDTGPDCATQCTRTELAGHLAELVDMPLIFPEPRQA
jgi:hypothetical protein